MRTAIIHDWLPVYAGAERVLEQMVNVFPEADLFSLIDFLPEEQRAFIKNKPVTTSFIQRMPFARRAYRTYLPFAPLAVEQFDLSAYDVVVSSSYVVAKGVLTSWRQLHISYVHSPIRYAWDLYWQYLREAGLERGLRSMMARLVLHYMRLFDVASANRVDAFVANSHHVARRIWKTYRRKATVIYPPVDTETYTLQTQKDDYYLTVSRLVPYKKVGLIVEAFTQMPDKKLVVIGDGPDFKKIRGKAGPNVDMLGHQPAGVLKQYLEHARAFVFAAEEDFGIAPVEAQACGTPVIAYGRGGIRETVIDGETGLFFLQQTTESLKEAVRAFDAGTYSFDPARVRRNAERFSKDQFRQRFAAFVEQTWERFQNMDEPDPDKPDFLDTGPPTDPTRVYLS
ncbi:MAG: glycosyltransferase family 4 protein [Rhodothermales bacterium]